MKIKRDGVIVNITAEKEQCSVTVQVNEWLKHTYADFDHIPSIDGIEVMVGDKVYKNDELK